ncbi:hypothetical protein KIN20_015621 [Parelaphostrongylus tenuis]|uniref:Uncharacterized protein n=1 Tax=Parelaphostrongylus tenuis TaxID=148309 RepID=A0AAD5QMD6_PARTN|nr:hypothetical protein KIN20_015621 [Parelaphostrongylus tenuis]
MTLAPPAMLKLDHRHGRLSRNKGTNGICAGISTTSEDGPFQVSRTSIRLSKMAPRTLHSMPFHRQPSMIFHF